MKKSKTPSLKALTFWRLSKTGEQGAENGTNVGLYVSPLTSFHGGKTPAVSGWAPLVNSQSLSSG